MLYDITIMRIWYDMILYDNTNTILQLLLNIYI